MPRQVFTAGEILTAANMNDLADSTVMVFDDASARTTAIPTPVEGMTTYLKDLDAVEFFDGSVFRRVGGLIAVKSAFRDTPFVASNIAGGANVAVPDLSITHEVADSANRLIISAFFGAASSSSGRGNVGIAVDDGTGLINVGAAAGGRPRVSAGGITDNATSVVSVTMPSVTFVHTPGAGSKTYTVRAVNIDSQRTLIINRREDDTDQLSNPRAVSSLVIQEVAV
jgi:hypothetical protein